MQDGIGAEGCASADGAGAPGATGGPGRGPPAEAGTDGEPGPAGRGLRVGDPGSGSSIPRGAYIPSTLPATQDGKRRPWSGDDVPATIGTVPPSGAEVLPMSWRTLSLLFFCLTARPGLADTPARPNILWITCEDMSPNLGCYGDPYAVTPNLDRLAAQGVRYTHAFTVAGVCAPSRSCLITGMYPPSLGTHHMRCPGTLPDRRDLLHRAPARRPATTAPTTSRPTTTSSTPPAAWDESSRQAHWRQAQAGPAVLQRLQLHRHATRARSARREAPSRTTRRG